MATTASLTAANTVLARLAAASVLTPHPHLAALHIGGPRSWRDIVDARTELPSSLIAAFLTQLPGLGELHLDSVTVSGVCLSPNLWVDVRMPQLSSLWACGLVCEDGVAEMIGRCLGPHTIQINVLEVPWPTQRILLGHASRQAPREGLDRLEWNIGGDNVPPEHQADFQRWVRRCSVDRPGFEAIRDESDPPPWVPRTEALVHASDAALRVLVDPQVGMSPSIVASRLADPSYGRSLKRISIYSDERDPPLEAVCGPRGISISYYT